MKSKKNILVLGSNLETRDLIKHININNISHNVGLEKNNLTKKTSHKQYLGDASNYDFVKRIVIENDIDAVMCGTVDILLPTYEKICSIFKYPKYTNSLSIKYFLSKKNFNKLLKKFKFKIIPSFRIDNISKFNPKNFPVLTKPDDSGLVVGYYRISVTFFSIIFSGPIKFLYKPLKAIFALILYPINFLEFWTNLSSENDRIAGGYYIIGKKK